MAPEPSIAPQARRLVVVDDDRLFLDVFAANLAAGGFHPACFDDAGAALAALRGGLAAVACVVDLDMPRLDGLGFLRALKAAGLALPVVFVTSHAAPMFEEAALREGAVDFIDKSRGAAIILRRLDLVLRPRASIPDGCEPDLRCGRLTLQVASRRALWQDREVPLSRTEFDVVHRLAAASGRDVGYRKIYDAVKGEGFVAGLGEDGYRANVRATVKRIRRKFETVDPAFDRLVAYPGFGYRWRDDD
jgi:two-component system response regulator ChvI